MTDTHVVAVCGSLSEESTTRAALHVALDAAREAGATTELVDLREYDLPVFDPDDRDVGDASRLKRTVAEADAVLLGTPNYHGSYSGALKNALDYLGHDEFEGKTVGILTVAGGSFPTPALEHLRGVCRAVGAWVLPHQVAVPRSGSTFRDGELVDEAFRERVADLGRETVEYAGVDRYPEVPESEREGEEVAACD